MTDRQKRIAEIEREIKRLQRELDSLREKEAQDVAPYFAPSREPLRVETYGSVRIPVYR